MAVVREGDVDYDDDNDYHGYNTPSTSRVDEITLAMSWSTDKQETSILQLRQETKRYKLVALYMHLSINGNLELINIDPFELATDPK